MKGTARAKTTNPRLSRMDWADTDTDIMEVSDNDVTRRDNSTHGDLVIRLESGHERDEGMHITIDMMEIKVERASRDVGSGPCGSMGMSIGA